MSADLKSFSLFQLIEKLHNAVAELIEAMDTAIAHNREIRSDEINALREHISERLKRNEDIEDNKKMIQILDLFKKNSLIMELAKEDVEKWLAFFDAIEQKLEENNGVKLTEKELNDINQIKRLTKDLKEMIRK